MQESILNGPNLMADFHVKEGKIVRVNLAKNPMSNGFHWAIYFEDGKESHEIPSMINQWVKEYCSKKEPSVLLPISLEHLPPFTEKVLNILKTQPFGTTLTYTELASFAGNPRAVRAAGAACGRNPCLLILPCHRVVAAMAKLGGFSAGVDIKSTLLQFES